MRPFLRSFPRVEWLSLVLSHSFGISNSTLQVVITWDLSIELFALTVVMSIVSAFGAIFRVIRVDPAIVLTR
ncbi:MAG TPA: hypothetical protein VGI22_16185 [Xanthobacteraceae bacterium]|jgi:ABC-type antimicrobial peptide transport system permease subunit